MYQLIRKFRKEKFFNSKKFIKSFASSQYFAWRRKDRLLNVLSVKPLVFQSGMLSFETRSRSRDFSRPNFHGLGVVGPGLGLGLGSWVLVSVSWVLVSLTSLSATPRNITNRDRHAVRQCQGR